MFRLHILGLTRDQSYHIIYKIPARLQHVKHSLIFSYIYKSHIYKYIIIYVYIHIHCIECIYIIQRTFFSIHIISFVIHESVPYFFRGFG